MAVGKRHTAGSAVVSGRKIDDLIGHHVDGELAVIDAVITLVKENRRVAHGEPHDLTFLAESTVAIVPGQGPVAHPNTHRNRSYHGIVRSTFLRDDLARQAPENSGRLDVWPQSTKLRLNQKQSVR